MPSDERQGNSQATSCFSISMYVSPVFLPMYLHKSIYRMFIMYILRFIYIYMYVYAHRHLYSTEKICCPSSSATAIWGATNDSTAHGMPLRQTEDCSLTAVQKLWDLTQWMLGSLDDVAVRRTQFCPQTEVRWIRRVASGVCYSLCKRRKKSITYFSIHTWFYVLWMCWLCMYTYTYIYIYTRNIAGFTVNYASENALLNSSMS